MIDLGLVQCRSVIYYLLYVHIYILFCVWQLPLKLCIFCLCLYLCLCLCVTAWKKNSELSCYTGKYSVLHKQQLRCMGENVSAKQSCSTWSFFFYSLFTHQKQIKGWRVSCLSLSAFCVNHTMWSLAEKFQGTDLNRLWKDLLHTFLDALLILPYNVTQNSSAYMYHT